MVPGTAFSTFRARAGKGHGRGGTRTRVGGWARTCSECLPHYEVSRSRFRSTHERRPSSAARRSRHLLTKPAPSPRFVVFNHSRAVGRYGSRSRFALTPPCPPCASKTHSTQRRRGV